MPNAEIKQIKQIKQVDCVTGSDKTLTIENASANQLEVFCNQCGAFFSFIAATDGTIKFIKSEINSTGRPTFKDVELIDDGEGFTARISCDYAGEINSETQTELF